MTVLQPPLTPADCDLRDFPFMPLDVVRLRDSDLAATETAEGFRAAVMLWCASWHQLPAASLPDDDRVLANLAGYGRVVKEWQKEREGALRGWVMCSDGRLYHPVVAEKAVEAWRGKLERIWRTECARIKKHNQRHEDQPPLPLPEFDDWLAAGRPQGQTLIVHEDRKPQSQGQQGKRPQFVPMETASKGQGEGQRKGQGQGQLSITPLPPKGGCQRFENFWTAWPKSERKQDKVKCARKWKSEGLDAVADAILADIATKRQTEKWRGGFIEAPLVYLNGRRWEDGTTPNAGDETSIDPDSRAAVEAEGERLGLGTWDENTEQWHTYKARVRDAQDSEERTPA